MPQEFRLDGERHNLPRAILIVPTSKKKVLLFTHGEGAEIVDYVRKKMPGAESRYLDANFWDNFDPDCELAWSVRLVRKPWRKRKQYSFDYDIRGSTNCSNRECDKGPSHICRRVRISGLGYAENAALCRCEPILNAGSGPLKDV